MTTYINSKYSLLRFQKELLVYAYIKEYCTESFKTTPIEIIQLCDKYLIFGLTEKINDTLIILKRIINKSNIQTQKQPMVTLKQQPSFLQNGKLRDYQLTGLNWLIERQNINLNCILCDEMGLGKTIQCISLLAYNLECKNINIDNKLKICSRCKNAFYCNKRCQKYDWKNHRNVCRQRTEAALICLDKIKRTPWIHWKE
eukprot:468390_1